MARSRSATLPKLVFSVGVPFSGSTAFGNLINALSPHAYVGELDRLPQNLPFYGGLAGLAVCHKCRVAGETCPYWNDDEIATLATLANGEVYARLLKRVQHDLIVDGSKTPGYFQRVAHEFHPQWDVRVVVLTRNPIHAMASFLGARRARGLELVPWQAANFWRDNYAHITSVVSSFGFPVLYFPTEVLRTVDPTELADRTLVLRRFLGLESVPMPSSSAGAEELFTVSHQYGGNGNVQKGRERSQVSTFAASLRAERWDELADAWVQAPGAVDLAKAVGINVRQVLERDVR